MSNLATNIVNNGKFIVIYGMNNLGKTTKINLLKKYFLQRNISIDILKFPNYNLKPTGHKLFNYSHQGNTLKISPKQTIKLAIQNQLDFQPEIKRILEKGTWIVCENYFLDNIIWGQMHDLNMDFLINEIETYIQPDLSILFDGKEQFSSGIDPNHPYETDQKIWNKGRGLYLNLCNDYNLQTIQADRDKEKVFIDLIKQIQLNLK